MTKKEKDTLAAYSIFEEGQGKMVLEDLEKSCFMKDTPFVSDPYITAFNCGKQDVYQRIIMIMEELKKPVKRQEKAEIQEETEK